MKWISTKAIKYLVLVALAVIVSASTAYANFTVTIYFMGIKPTNTQGGYQYVNITASGYLTCNGATSSFSNVYSVTCTSTGNPVYVKVTGVGIFGTWVWDSSHGNWVPNINYTISTGGRYALIAAGLASEVSSNPVPGSNSGVSYQVAGAALHTALVPASSLPSLTDIIQLNGAGLSAVIGRCCAGQPPVQPFAPYYYLTSSGFASGASVNLGTIGYGVEYYIGYTNLQEPIPMVLPGAYYFEFMNPGAVYGFYFYAPPPSGYYDNYYLPGSSSYMINKPVTIQVQFTVTGSPASGVILEEQNSYYPNAPSWWIPIIWIYDNTAYVFVTGGCTLPSTSFPVRTGNTYTVTIFWNTSNSTAEVYENGAEIYKTSSLPTCNAGYSTQYLAIGDGWTTNWKDTTGGWMPLTNVVINYIAIWQNQATATPSNNPTFQFSGVGNNPAGGYAGDTITVIPGDPIYIGVYNGQGGFELYTGSYWNVNLTIPMAPSTVGYYMPTGYYIGPMNGAYNYPLNTVIMESPNGWYFNGWCGVTKIIIVTEVTGTAYWDGGTYPVIVYFGTFGGLLPDDFVTTPDWVLTGYQLGGCNGLTPPSSVPAFLVPNTAQWNPSYLVIPVNPSSGAILGTYIGRSFVPGLNWLATMDFTLPCSTTTMNPSTLSLTYYLRNGTQYTSGTVNSPVNPIYVDTSLTGWFYWNGTFYFVPGLLPHENVTNISITRSYESITVYIGTESGGSVYWIPPIALQGIVGDTLDFGYVFPTISTTTSSLPQTQYSIEVPSCALNAIGILTLYSYPSSAFSSMIGTITNPLYIALTATGISSTVVNSTVTVSPSNVSPAVPAPVTMKLPQLQLTGPTMLFVTLATTALGIVFIRKHTNMGAGLMIMGSILTGAGFALGISMLYIVGVLMFVFGFALVMAQRKPY